MKPVQPGQYQINFAWGEALRPSQAILRDLLKVGCDLVFLVDIPMMNHGYPQNERAWSYVVEDDELKRYYIFSRDQEWVVGDPLDLRKTLGMYGEIEKQALRGLIRLEEQMQEKLQEQLKQAELGATKRN